MNDVGSGREITERSYDVINSIFRVDEISSGKAHHFIQVVSFRNIEKWSLKVGREFWDWSWNVGHICQRR